MNKNKFNTQKKVSTFTVSSIGLVMVMLLLASFTTACAADYEHEIIVIPQYTEKGIEAKDEVAHRRDYKNLMKVISARLMQAGILTRRPESIEIKAELRDKDDGRSVDDSIRLSKDLCNRYGTDGVYLLGLELYTKKTSDGLYKVFAVLNGEGFTDAGVPFGGTRKKFQKTGEIREVVIGDVEVEVAWEVARLITKKSTLGKRNTKRSRNGLSSQGRLAAQANDSDNDDGNVISNTFNRTHNIHYVELKGGNEPEVLEFFEKVLKSSKGVDTKRTKSVGKRILKYDPQNSFKKWRVYTTDGADFDIIVSNIKKTLQQIALNSDGSEIIHKGIPFRYTANEAMLALGIYEDSSTSHTHTFIVDREKVRDALMGSVGYN